MISFGHSKLFGDVEVGGLQGALDVTDVVDVGVAVVVFVTDGAAVRLDAAVSVAGVNEDVGCVVMTDDCAGHVTD